MRRSIVIAILAIGFTTAGLATTQGVFSAETASPVPAGSVVTLRIEATQSMELRFACPTVVRSFSPTGPIVWQWRNCSSPGPIVGPGSPATTLTWPGVDTNNRPVGPGLYYLFFEGRPANTTLPYQAHFVPVRFDPATGPIPPVLSAGTATRGQALNLVLNDPTMAQKQYWIAASFGTNTGFWLSRLTHVALDADPLFFLSVNGLLPATGFQGTLDATGNATAQIQLPAILPQGSQLAFQAVVGTQLAFSNPVQKIIN